jgi:hypothetical protein
MDEARSILSRPEPKPTKSITKRVTCLDSIALKIYVYSGAQITDLICIRKPER